MKYKVLFAIFFVFILATSTSQADVADTDYKYDQYISKLDKINYLPVLLPVILNNRDVIELTDEQVRALNNWRAINREKVLSSMNEIVKKRAEILEVALATDVSSDQITKLQDEIFEAQRAVLDYKLSCRDLVFKTFNEKNWEGFMFVLAETNSNIAFVH